MPSSMARPMSSGVARFAPETSSSDRTATPLSHAYELRYASALRSAPAPECVSLPARRGPLRAHHDHRLAVAFSDPAVMVLCWHPFSSAYWALIPPAPV
jgi:hypothetical protein